VLRRLINEYARTGTAVLALQSISPAETRAYGVPRVREDDATGYAIEGLVEKPGPQRAPSLLGVVGRYVLPPSIFGYLRATAAGANGELQLTDALAALASAHEARGIALTQRRIDCGSPAGFLEAQLSASGLPLPANVPVEAKAAAGAAAPPPVPGTGRRAAGARRKGDDSPALQ
jgi:UTP--glucose-1-phosphate uridylyltransferase